MEHINELVNSLKHHLFWHKSRLECLGVMLIALFTVKTVNLAEIAGTFPGKSKLKSNYKRLQRFFRGFNFDSSLILNIVLELFQLKGKLLTFSIDRTNWKFGKKHINFLVLGIVYKSFAIPVAWEVLDRAGNSKTIERIAILEKIIKSIGKPYIKAILADREFVGEKWFNFLHDEKIPFYIRIKKDAQIKRSFKDYAVPVTELFKNLKVGKTKILKHSYVMCNKKIFLVASKNSTGELLIVATNDKVKIALDMYKKRWSIETLFACLKTKGFRLEETHITNPQRLEKLFFVLTLAFCWALKIGNLQPKQSPIKKKTHGRKEQSIFRRGLELIRRFFINSQYFKEELLRLIKMFFYRKRLKTHCEIYF